MGNSESKDSLSEAVQFGPCGTDPYVYFTFDESELPRGLKFSMKFLTRKQFGFCQLLCQLGQEHLFDDWETLEADERLALVEQLMAVDEALSDSFSNRNGTPGGLSKYIMTALKQLDTPHACKPHRSTMQIMNPVLKGFKPSVPAVPDNDVFEVGSTIGDSIELEQMGLRELGHVGFCVCAFRLGEGLVSGASETSDKPLFLLPTEVATETTFLQNFIEHVLAISREYTLAMSKDGSKEKATYLPICIMTSPDTYGPIRKFLETRHFFGMPPESVSILCRTVGLPAFADSEARLALDPADPTVVNLSSYRGHGDFHTMLYESGLARSWLEDRGLKWLYMIEHETNALAFHPLPLMLGVSKERGLIMNSLTVPRRAKDNTLGAVCALKNKKTSMYKTVSVEWHELEALLRANGYSNGEVNDPKTGFSPFRGSTNQLLFDLQDYVEILEHRHGVMPKFLHASLEPNLKDLEKRASIKNENDANESNVDHNAAPPHHKGKKHKKKNMNASVASKKSMASSRKSIEDEDILYEFRDPVPLRSRIQDFVHLLSTKQMDRVGYTHINSAGMAFSPVVHSIAEAVDPTHYKKRKEFKLPPYTASSAEADLYGASRKLMLAIGCDVERSTRVTHSGDVTVIPGPAVVLKPNFGFCVSQLKEKFPYPNHVRVKSGSTLVLRGSGIVVSSLDLDGCLLVDCEEGQETIIDRQVRNKGWKQVKDPYAANEIHRMRGYTLERFEEEAVEEVNSDSEGCGIF